MIPETAHTYGFSNTHVPISSPVIPISIAIVPSLTSLSFVCPVVPTSQEILKVVKRITSVFKLPTHVDNFELPDHCFSVRVAVNDDDNKLRLLRKILQKNLLPLTDGLVLPLPLTNQKLALAFEHHVDVARVRLRVGCNHSFELKEINVSGVGVVHQFLGHESLLVDRVEPTVAIPIEHNNEYCNANDHKADEGKAQ